LRIDTIGGRIHVRNAPSSAPEVVEPVLVLGRDLEAEPEIFGDIRAIALSPDGTLYVGDSHALEIRAFAPTGEFLRVIGRRGRGPGEFQQLYSMALLGDTLIVHDPGNARLALFGPDGEPVSHWPASPITGDYEGIAVDSLGRAYVYTWVPKSKWGGFAVVRSGAVLDTLGFESLLGAIEPSAGFIFCIGTDQGIHTYLVPYAPRHLRAVSPGGGLVAAWSDAYAIHFISAEGDTTRTVEVDVPPLPIPAAVRDSIRRGYERWRRRPYLGRCEPEDAAIPEFKPFIRDILFDRVGRMWVEVYRERGYGFDVFDRSGVLLGRFTLAGYGRRGARPAVAGRRVAVVARSPLGIERVLRYELPLKD
jgi:hypothetical protein